MIKVTRIAGDRARDSGGFAKSSLAARVSYSTMYLSQAGLNMRNST